MPPLAMFPLIQQSSRVNGPELKMPPPCPKTPGLFRLPASPTAELPLTVQFESVSVPPLRTPPPCALPEEAVTRPLVIANPEIETVVLVMISKTRLALLPLTARTAGPGPRMVIFLTTASSPPVSVMVPVTFVAKVMTSPLPAGTMAARNEPGPLSARVATVLVAAFAEIKLIRRKTHEPDNNR